MRNALIAAVLVIAPLVAQANTELTIKAERTAFPVNGVQQINNDKKPPANQTIHLTIGNRWVQWADGNGRGVYDFAKRLNIRVDPAARRLVEESLFATLSSRGMELDNRLMSGETVNSVKAEDNPVSPTIAEHQLSIRRDGKQPSGIERKSGDGAQRYFWQEKELFSYSTKLVPLPAAARDLYIRYVRYSVGGHPDILADLQKLDGIPKWLQYRDPAYGDAVRLEVIEIKESPDAHYTLPPLEKTTLKNPQAAAAAAIVLASTPESRAAASARILATANAAADSGKPLEAVLGYFEGRLMVDGDLPPDFTQRADRLLNDANVKRFRDALQVSSPAQAKISVATLTALAPLAGDKAYVTGIFRANMEWRLDNAKTATDLLVTALTKNPFITGVWKDLGQSLGSGNDPADAWRCYAIARMINPTHGLLGDINNLEAALTRDYPEYF